MRCIFGEQYFFQIILDQFIQMASKFVFIEKLLVYVMMGLALMQLFLPNKIPWSKNMSFLRFCCLVSE